jgi:hypothetical protein
MRRMALAALAIGVFVGVVFAQPAPRKPGDEQKRVGYFAGRWNYEGEAKPSPMGPGGKSSFSETCEWFDGGFHLVCHSEGKSPMGAGKGRSVIGYDPNEKTYTYYAISSLGEGFFVRGTVSDKVWTWNNETTVDGKPLKVIVTITEQSPTSYSFKMETSFDGSPLAVLEEGKATKAK